MFFFLPSFVSISSDSSEEFFHIGMSALLASRCVFLYYGSGAPNLIPSSSCSARGNISSSMQTRSHILCELRDVLSAILAGTQTRAQLNQFVKQCNAIALTLIQSRIAAGTIQTKHFGLSAADIAFDAIADLFREDEGGSLVQIQVYFESIDWQNAEDEELLIQLRRLVFMRTNQGLFRMFQEVDPALGKILRNTKLAIAALNTFVETDHFGEPCIAPNLCEPLERLPMIERDALQQRMLELTNGSERIPVILAKLSRYLREQDEHSRIVPIMWVAYCIRSVYGRVEIEQSQQAEVEQKLAEDETHNILHEACARVKLHNETNYVSAERLCKEVYEKYFDVIERILEKRLITNDGHDVSLFKLMQEALPGLSREEYNATHKAKIEYLARLAEEQAVARLRNEIQRE